VGHDGADLADHCRVTAQPRRLARQPAPQRVVEVVLWCFADPTGQDVGPQLGLKRYRVRFATSSSSSSRDFLPADLKSVMLAGPAFVDGHDLSLLVFCREI